MSFDPSAARSGAVASDNPTYRGAWLCYVNGIEVPCVGYRVSGGVWKIPEFQVNFLPDSSIEDLGKEDKVQVALFYLDQWVDPQHPEWRLLIDGEIVGKSTVHTSGQRLLSFTCLSSIQLFQQLYFFFMNTVDDIVAAQSPDIQASGLTTAGLFYPYSLFHRGLFAPAKTGEQVAEEGNPQRHSTNVTGDDDATTNADDPILAPYELVYNVVKGLISADVPPEHKSVPMLNFFARHTRKCRLYNRFVRLPLFEDLSALADRKGVFPIFNAARNDEALGAMQRQMAGTISNSGPVWNILEQTLGSVYMEIGMVPNPACMVTDLDGQIQRLLDAGADVADQNEPTAPDFTAADQAAQASGAAAPTANRTPSQGLPTTTPARLAQYFVKPQLMFGVAPMCNVFFPSMLGTWTDDENYANQPTRIYVNDSVMTRMMRATGPNRDFMLHALSVAYPEEADAVLRNHMAEQGGDAHDTGKGLLIWPEEFYKGPVTAHMALPSWFQMLMQARNSGTGNDPSSGPGEVSTPAAAVSSPSPSNPTTAPVGTSSTPAEATATSTASVNPRVTGGASVTTPNGSTDGASQGNTPLPVVTGRGRVSSGPAFYFDAWNPPDSTRQIGNGVALIRGKQNLTVGELRGMRVQNPSWFRSDGDVVIVYPGTQEFARRMKFMFPQIRTTGGVDRLHNIASLPDNHAITFHQSGRAVDLMIPTRGSRTDHANGDPVANYLVEHAGEIGIQYLIWADAIWGFAQGWSRGFHPYVNTVSGHSPPNSTDQHRDHPHVQLTFEAAMMTTPWFRNAAPLPAGRSTTTYSSPRIPPPAPAAATTTTRPGPTPRSPDVVVVSRPAVTVSTYTNEGGDNPDRDTSFQRLFRIYAQYEFFRQRYMQRRLGLDNGVFNPYVVAGFPCVMLDNIGSGSHRVGYVMEYTHTAQAGSNGEASWGTSVQASCVRSYREFLNDIRTDCEAFAERVASAPAEIVPEVRRIIQDDGQAEKFYQSLLYGGTRPNGMPAAYHHQDVLGFSVGSGQNDFAQLTITGEGPDAAATIRAANDAAAAAAGTTTTGSTDTGATAPGTASSAVPAPTAADIYSAVLAAASPFASVGVDPQLRTAIQTLARVRAGDSPQVAKDLALQNVANILGPSSPAIAAAGNAADNVLNQTGARPQTSPAQSTSQSTVATTGTGTSSPTQSSAANPQTSRTNTLTVSHNLTDVNLPLAVVPGSPYMDAFDRADIALQLCARPACTLVQYIRFWHGGKTFGQCILDGVVEGEEGGFAYQPVTEIDVNGQDPSGNPQTGLATRQPASFWRRIYRLRQGPGTPPTDSQRGYVLNPPGPAPTRDGVAGTYPQTRADWDTVLLNYRLKVRTLVSPGL